MLTLSLFWESAITTALANTKQPMPVKKDAHQVCYRPDSQGYKTLTRVVARYETLHQCLQSSKHARLPSIEQFPAGHTPFDTTERQRGSLLGQGADEYHEKDWGGFYGKVRGCRGQQSVVLQARSERPVTYQTRALCHVKRGVWVDDATQAVIIHATQLQFSHIIPPHYAHRHGGHAWSLHRKQAFFNDPANLWLSTHPLYAHHDQALFDYSKDQLTSLGKCHHARQVQQMIEQYQMVVAMRDQVRLKQRLAACRKSLSR